VAQSDLPLPSFKPAEFDWADIFETPLKPIGHANPPTPLFPPSPPSSIDVSIDNSLAFLFPPAIMPQSLPVVGDFDGSPTPPPTDTESQIANQSFTSSPVNSPPAPPIRRRGPGRPRKTQSSDAPISGRSLLAVRREFHNDSAMRSRARVNTALDGLWNEVPEKKRIQALGKESERQVSRAEKVEIVISYIRDLKARLYSGGHV
jgi:hypothetical protein